MSIEGVFEAHRSCRGYKPRLYRSKQKVLRKRTQVVAILRLDTKVDLYKLLSSNSRKRTIYAVVDEKKSKLRKSKMRRGL